MRQVRVAAVLFAVVGLFIVVAACTPLAVCQQGLGLICHCPPATHILYSMQRRACLAHYSSRSHALSSDTLSLLHMYPWLPVRRLVMDLPCTLNNSHSPASLLPPIEPADRTLPTLTISPSGNSTNASRERSTFASIIITSSIQTNRCYTAVQCNTAKLANELFARVTSRY